MINITQVFGGLPVFWIRYNPDSFKLPDNTKSKITHAKRESHLLEWIKYALENIRQHLGEVVYLFYDGCEEHQSSKNVTVNNLITSKFF